MANTLHASTQVPWIGGLMASTPFRIMNGCPLIYAEAKLLQIQSNSMYAYFVNKNKQLILGLSERLAIKYMCLSENDFSRLVETFMIIANN